jgi:uncharacterized membrane protein (UPF0127 family)
MTKWLRIVFLGLALYVGLLVYQAVFAIPPAVVFPRGSMTLISQGVEHRFEVELALTPEAQGRGLMLRESLADNQGMLFIYPRVMPITLWMKSTLIPLDMVFFTDQGVVHHLIENAEPETLTMRSSNGPVRGVVELPGGTVKRLGIAVGDRLTYDLKGAGRGT